ncbi:MAG: hypothetical protein ACYCW6_28450 [Candidatus Xenobia bacterium]
MRVSKTIAGHTFDFTGERHADGTLEVKCQALESEYFPLCAVVGTSWHRSPKNLVDSVLNQHGQGFEGAVSFAYNKDYPQEDYPDETGSKEGVTADFLDEEVTVSEAFFKAFVGCFGQVYFEMADSWCLDVGHLADIRRTIQSWQAAD